MQIKIPINKRQGGMNNPKADRSLANEVVHAVTPHNESAPETSKNLIPHWWQIALALLAVYVIWGSTYLSIRVAVTEMPPFWMAAVRFSLAGMLMLAIARLRREPWPTRAQLRDCIITGILLLGFGNGLVCFAEQTVSSGLAAVAVASMPLWAALFAGMYGRWPVGWDWLGLAIGFIGIVMLNLNSDMRTNAAGAIALVIAPMAWALGSVWSKQRKMPTPMMSTAMQMLGAVLPLLLVSALSQEAWSLRFSAVVWGHLWYLVIAGSIIGFTAYIYLLNHVRPALATSYAYVNPPIAVMIGVWLANETVTRTEILAMVVILFGVALIVVQRSRA